MFKISSDTASQIGGQRFISPEIAVITLEYAVTRWNMVVQCPDPPDDTSARKRRVRRRICRTSTSQTQADLIAQFALYVFSRGCHSISQTPSSETNESLAELPGDNGDHEQSKDIDGIDSRMGSLGILLSYLDLSWLQTNLPGAAYNDHEEHMGLNSTSTLDLVSSEGGRGKKRGDGAKRCSRCHKYKIAGSGHGRSQCDDGYGISSVVPYPAAILQEALATG